MDNTRAVVEILNGTKQLFEVVPRELLVEASFVVLNFDEGKQVALLDQFQDNEVDLNCLLRFLNHYLAIDVVLHKPNDVRVIHLLEQCDFVQQNLLKHLQTNFLHVVPFYNLYGIKLVAVEL